MPEDDIQRKVYEFETLQKKVESLTQTRELLNSELEELEETQESLGEIKNLEDGDEIFFPLGSNSYGYGKITNSKEVLVNVGGNAIVSQEIPDAKDTLEEKKEEFEEQLSNLDETIEKAQKKLQRLQAEIQKSSG